MSGGRKLRTKAESEAVPTWSIVSDGFGATFVAGWGSRPNGARVGDRLIAVAVPVEVLQRHEAEVGAEAPGLRGGGWFSTADGILARHRELWPEVLAVEVESVEDVARRVQAAEVPDPDDARRLAAAVIGEKGEGS